MHFTVLLLAIYCQLAPKLHCYTILEIIPNGNHLSSIKLHLMIYFTQKN